MHFTSDTSPSKLAITSTTFFIQNYATSLTFEADVMVFGGNIPVAVAPNKNFKISMKFAEHSNGSDSLGLPTVTTNIIPASDLEKALVNGIANANTLKGSATMTLASAQCVAVHYLCVHVDTGVGAMYVDAIMSNNYLCHNIDSQKSCNPRKYLRFLIKSSVTVQGVGMFMRFFEKKL